MNRIPVRNRTNAPSLPSRGVGKSGGSGYNIGWFLGIRSTLNYAMPYE